MTAEEAAARAERDAAFHAENVTQLENTHRIVIPNYETNERLYNSLVGADGGRTGQGGSDGESQSEDGGHEDN